MDDVARAFIAQSRDFLKTDYLPKIERCLERLSDEEVWWRSGDESNSIGNLLLHLAGNVRQWIVSSIGGAADDRVRQQEFDERSIIARGELLERLRRVLNDADKVLASLTGEQLLESRQIQGGDVNVLEAIYHVVEHFSMHTGQIILLTKMLKNTDLRFYDFSDGIPAPSWNKSPDA